MVTANPLATLLLSLFLLLLGFLGHTPAVAAAQTSSSLGTLSTCGLTCLLGGISRSNCSDADVACQCANSAVEDAVTSCLLANCTMQESLDVSRLTAVQCHLSHDSQATQVMAIMSALWGASLVFVVLRALSKYMTRTFFIEDHIIIASVVLAVVPMVCVLYSEEYLVSLRSLIFHVDETDEPLFAQNIVAALGFGSHIYDLEDGALPQILRLFYVAEIIYVVALALTKASILSMYLRIFWAFPPFQVACYLALGFILLPSAVITLVTIFSCRPVAYFWDRDVRVALAAASAGAGVAALPTCVDVGALAYANSGFAVAQDVVLIALPVGMLWRLNMSRRRKALVAVMFAVGSLGLVATVARLRVLYVFGDFTDPTWTWVPVVYWTTAELAAGIICSCLPAVRILLERFSRVFRLTTTTGGEGGAAGGECSSHVVAIRMERARRQTAGDADAEEGRWKDGEWMEMGDGASERGLTQTREGDDDMSDYLTPRGHGPKGIRSDFEIGI